MDSLNLSPINDDNIHNEDNSANQSSDLNSNQLPQSIEGTPYRSQDSIKYQQNNTPSRELQGVQQKLTNSPGLDGLVRKCNTLKVQSQTQSAVQSQFYQQNVDHSLDIRQQLLATNHLLPPNYHKVQDQQVQSIFGDFKTPSKDQSKQQSNHELDAQGQAEGQNNRLAESSGYKERLSAAPVDARLILSQKIVTSIGQPSQQVKENKEQEEGDNKQSGELDDQQQQQQQQFGSTLFGQSINKAQDLHYDPKFQRMMQSSSPVDQYKYYHNGGTANGLAQYQMGYTNLKWEVQQQQQQIKPKKDLKNNFQSYLSLIGLGSNRSNHHGSTLSNAGNQLYFANKGQTQTNHSALQSLYRVSSTERSSMRNVPQIAKPLANNISNNNNNSGGLAQAQKRRTGLEGIIDKINIKKDSLLHRKGQQGGLNQNSLLNANSSSANQGTALSSSNNTNNLIKLSRIHPNTHQSSKQTELEGSLEKIRLISMQRNINYTSNLSKENDQQQKLSQFLKSSGPQQQQNVLSQPLTNTVSSLRPTASQGGNLFSSTLASSMGVGQRFSNKPSNQLFQNDKYQPLQSQKGLASTLTTQQPKQQVLNQPVRTEKFNNNLAEPVIQIYESPIPVRSENLRKETDKQQEQIRDDIPQQDLPSANQEEQLNFDAFEDYDEKVNANTQESDVANFNFASE